jgi:hypothetical protein
VPVFAKAVSASRCMAASCECGYVFDAITDAHSRWHSGRLQCAGCAGPHKGAGRRVLERECGERSGRE